MKKDLILKFKKILESRKQSITEHILKFAKITNSGEFEVLPKDYGDSEDENSEEISDKNEDESTLATLDEELHQIEKAMEKVNNGTYGRCSKCGELIEEKRLEFNPSATYCSKCQNKIEKDLI